MKTKLLSELFVSPGFMSLCSTVEFACEDDMKRAIRKLDGTELMGKRIKLIEVQCHFYPCITGGGGEG